MNNFTFQNPVKLIMGKGMITNLSNEISKEDKILITFGGGSVKKNGVYQQVIDTLEGYDIVEFWGIEPNPKVETLRKAVDLGREKGVNFVLAVGGGSVIDGSKLICAALKREEDPWDLVLSGKPLIGNTPLGVVLTLPATGSEMNCGGVISSTKTSEKYAFYGDYPKFSILDPQVTFSLPLYQVACGLADTFVHTMEQYMTSPKQSRVMDRWAEGLLMTLIEIAPQIKQNPKNYDLMADFMLSATMALNGFISMGVTQDWATHMIGHEITALTGLTHGHTLAIILPATLEVLKEQKFDKLLQYAERVWHIDRGSANDKVDKAIAKTREFFSSLGLTTSLHEEGIDDGIILEVKNRFNERKVTFGESRNVTGDVAYEILKECM